MIHFRSYLATIIAVVVKENSDTPSPCLCICIPISIADHITDIRIIRIIKIRIIKMSDESQSSLLHEIKKTLRLICHRCLFQSTPVDGYRGLVEVIASEQLQLHLVLAVVEAVDLF